jgi:hypothetical protein
MVQRTAAWLHAGAAKKKPAAGSGLNLLTVEENRGDMSIMPDRKNY